MEPRTTPVIGKIPSVYMQRLDPLLESCQRGDTLTDAMILEVVPELLRTSKQATYLDGLLRKWFMRYKAIKIKRRNNNGYYLLTDIEQAASPGERARLARRQFGRGVIEGQGVDPQVLPESNRRKLEHDMRIITTQLQLATEAVNRIRLELVSSTVEQRKISNE